jgi:hypothetical protein
VTGVVTRWDTVDGQDILLVKVRPWCDHHEWNTGPCCKVREVGWGMVVVVGGKGGGGGRPLGK